jgi:hypothetical protein
LKGLIQLAKKKEQESELDVQALEKVVRFIPNATKDAEGETPEDFIASVSSRISDVYHNHSSRLDEHVSRAMNGYPDALERYGISVDAVNSFFIPAYGVYPAQWLTADGVAAVSAD